LNDVKIITGRKQQPAKRFKPRRLHEYRQLVVRTLQELVDEPVSEDSDETLLTFQGPIGATSLSLLHFHIYPDMTQSEPMTFSFNSHAWHVFFDLGVAQCMRDLIKSKILDDACYTGSSTGSIVAVAMALNLDLFAIKEALKQVAIDNSESVFGPFNGLSRPMRRVLNKHIWKDIEYGKDRLTIQLTRINILSLSQVSKSSFDSKKVVVIDIGSC
jgi:hypothetical protein